MMLRVGEKLQEWALDSSAVEDADSFGRSAFNRYYYASYLIVRDTLDKLDSKWASQSHKGIPELLSKTVLRKIRDQLKNLVRDGLITQAQSNSIRATANRIVSELSELLKESYHIRIIADYEPQISAKKDGNKIVLEGVSLDTARHQPSQVNALTKGLLRIWRGDLGL